MVKTQKNQLSFSKSLILKVFLLTCFLFLITACNNKNHLQGYIEGRYTYIAAQISGTLDQLLVQRGTKVKAGQLLFILDQEPETSELAIAKKKLTQSEEVLHDMQKGGRDTIIAAFQAQLERAKEDQELAKKTLYRYSNMVKVGAVSKSDFDSANTSYQSSVKSVNQMQANLNEVKLGARENALKAQQAVVEAAEADFKKSTWALEQKTKRAPVDSRVFDTYFNVGETVLATQSVVSLLAPKDIKLIFFIPERFLSKIALNKKIPFTCDSCQKKYAATINFISPEAEYTPPVIYSESSRDKLVYRIEAVLDDEGTEFFHPGQPVTILINNE